MKNILRNNLRCGDVICEWGSKNFLVMLMNIEKDDVKKVINRIKICFKETLNSQRDVEIYYNYYKVQQFSV